jgi:hypothetical protein
MARQGAMSTPIFDQLLREMTEGMVPPPQPAQPSSQPDPEPQHTAATAPRRRHRAD